jgi:hypothetical protein
MREMFLTVALVAAALLITFGVAATLEQTAFKAGPEPGVGAPSGTMPPPGERRGRSGKHLA